MFTASLTLRRITLYKDTHALFSLARPADTRHTLTLRGSDIVILHPEGEQLLWTATDSTEARDIITTLTMALHQTGRPTWRCWLTGSVLALVTGLAVFSLQSPEPSLPDLPPSLAAIQPTQMQTMPSSAPAPMQVVSAPPPAIPSTGRTAPVTQPQPLPSQSQPLLSRTAPATPLPALSPVEFKAAQNALAENLRNAADKHYFTIPLSSGHSRTLYVFADPLCPHCRTFEPALQALSADVNITVFPVTLIGKAGTAKEVVPLLCAPYESRPVLWRRLFDEGAGMLNIGHPDTPLPACDVGRIALQRNDKALALYHLPGTPAVISDDGRMVPLMAMSSVEALNTFLKGDK